MAQLLYVDRDRQIIIPEEACLNVVVATCKEAEMGIAMGLGMVIDTTTDLVLLCVQMSTVGHCVFETIIALSDK